MFRRLHKIAVVLLIALPFLLGWYLYQKRSVFSPVTDFYQALKISGGKFGNDLETVSGEVIRLSENYTFTLKNDDGQTLRFRLTGIEAPHSQNLGRQNGSSILTKSREEMSALTLSNRVQVAPTYQDRNRSGLGVLYVGETNVNALLVKRGLAQVKREFLQGVKLTDVYALLRAQRAADKIESN